MAPTVLLFLRNPNRSQWSGLCEGPKIPQKKSPDCSGLLCSSPGARNQEVPTILHSRRSRQQVTRVPLPNGVAVTECPCGSADTVVVETTMLLLLWSIVVLLFAAGLSLGMLRN